MVCAKQNVIPNPLYFAHYSMIDTMEKIDVQYRNQSFAYLILAYPIGIIKGIFDIDMQMDFPIEMTNTLNCDKWHYGCLF